MVRRAARWSPLLALVLAGAACSSATTASSDNHNADSTVSVPTNRTTGPVVTQNATTRATQLVALDGRARDSFGGTIWYDTYSKPIKPVFLDTPSVAAMSADGSVAVIGAPGAAGRKGATGAGKAYVFARRGQGWAQVATLTAPNGKAYDAFGSAVALSGDGHDVLIGAPYTDRGEALDVGSAYVFHAVNGQWKQATELRARDEEAYDNFGWSVAMARDGLTALVGSPSHAVGYVPDAGAAYVFTRPSGYGQWTQIAALHAPTPRAHADYGAAVALSGDGSTAATTEVSHVDADRRLLHGSTYLAGSGNGWKTWRQLAHFNDPHRNGSRSDSYGVGVAMSDDGRVVAVSAPAAAQGSGKSAKKSVGAVDVYSTSGAWTDKRANSRLTLTPRKPANYLYYGTSTALSADGRSLLVGIDGAGLDAQGAAERVSLVPAGAGRPGLAARQRLALDLPNSQSARYGAAVAMAADGRSGVVTAPMATVGKAAQQGAAFVYDWGAGQA